MRNKSYNTLDNLASKLDDKTRRMITEALINSIGDQDRNSDNIRDGLLNFGALQMSNIRSEDFAIFGSGFSGRRAGP